MHRAPDGQRGQMRGGWVGSKKPPVGGTARTLAGAGTGEVGRMSQESGGDRS